MAKIFINVIQSTSEGNSIVLYDGEKYLFLDFGTKPGHIKEYFSLNYIDKSSVAGVLITHSHIDHIRSLNYDVSRNLNIYATSETWMGINKIVNYGSFLKNSFELTSEWIKIINSNWSFMAIRTIHNALGSVCYIIKNKKSKILYLTDTEYFDNINFKGMDAYIVESNYGSYILDSKSKESKHINHKVNHMSSYDVEKFIQKYPTKKTKLFIMSHISSKSNDKFEVLEFAKDRYSTKKMKVEYLNPKLINKENFEF